MIKRLIGNLKSPPPSKDCEAGGDQGGAGASLSAARPQPGQAGAGEPHPPSHPIRHPIHRARAAGGGQSGSQDGEHGETMRHTIL